MIEAGSETTSATFNTGLLYLMANPPVVACAHAELTAVVSNHHSPTFADEDRLPYICRSCASPRRLRRQPPLHRRRRRLQRQRRHHQPDPARYLAYPLKSGAYVGQDDRDHWSFGAGRCICSGLHIAENSLFILFAKVLWAFYPRPPLDDNGVEIPVNTSDAAFESASVTVAKPYRCRLIPRKATVVATLQREWEEARQIRLGDHKVNVNA
ncbi:hypothetical protein VTN77DRAFT_4309 [Rasamsonia byssochlamydoides]|uniref:uncharacterized protein n=1 Tax=Rasamsonia byssochlamydoides TaxID=89139 RepID=UPI0037433D33